MYMRGVSKNLTYKYYNLAQVLKPNERNYIILHRCLSKDKK